MSDEARISVEIVVRENGREIYRCTTTPIHGDQTSDGLKTLHDAYLEARRVLKLPRF